MRIDPGVPVLPVDIVAQQVPGQLGGVGIFGVENVAGIIENKSVVFLGAAGAADFVVLLQEQGVTRQMIGRAQARRPGADDHMLVMIFLFTKGSPLFPVPIGRHGRLQIVGFEIGDGAVRGYSKVRCAAPDGKGTQFGDDLVLFLVGQHGSFGGVARGALCGRLGQRRVYHGTGEQKPHDPPRHCGRDPRLELLPEATAAYP